MILHRFVIDKVAYFVNYEQIKEAGSLEAAAKAMHEANNPKQKEEKKKGDKPAE